MSRYPSAYPGLAAAEESLYQLGLRANTTAWSMVGLMEHIDLAIYDGLEAIAPGKHQRPALRITRPERMSL